MPRDKFRTNLATFLSTNENTGSDRFDVSESIKVGVDCELEVEIAATKNQEDTLTDTSNIVNIIEEEDDGNNNGGGEPPTEQRSLPNTNGFALLPDITFYDDFYGLGDGILGSGVHDNTIQVDSFNPEPTADYPVRTNMLNMTSNAFVGENVNVKSPWYFTLFENEGSYDGFDEHFIFAEERGSEDPSNPLPPLVRIDIDAICGPADDPNDRGRIGRALDSNFYYGDGKGDVAGEKTLDGVFLQLDLEGAPHDNADAPSIIQIIEAASVFWNHPEFDRTPWETLGQDMIDTCNRVREKFPGIFVTWYGCPKLPHWLSIRKDLTVNPIEGDQFPGVYPLPPGAEMEIDPEDGQLKTIDPSTATTDQWSDIIPKRILNGSWEENLYNKMKQSFFDAIGPVMEAFDAYHIRYYVNRSVSNPEYDQLEANNALFLSKIDTDEDGVLTDNDISVPIPKPDSEHLWSEQKDCVIWCREYNEANNLQIPIMPTTAPYNVSGPAGAVAGYGSNTLTLPDVVDIDGAGIQVWQNDVELLFSNGAYSVANSDDGFDTIVTLNTTVRPNDSVRINYTTLWNGSKIVLGPVQTSKWDDPAGLEGIYDARFVNIDSFDDKITKVWSELQPDGVFWWTSGVGRFPAYTLDETRQTYTFVEGFGGLFSEARKAGISTWYNWLDLNYITGGWLFGDDERLQTARGFWDNKDENGDPAPVGAGPRAEDPTIRDKWITTWGNYLNSHYAQPVVDAVNAGDGKVPPRLWSTLEFDSGTWDDISTGAMIVQNVFFRSGSPSVNFIGLQEMELTFTVPSGVLTESTPPITLAENRNRAKIRVRLANEFELTSFEMNMSGDQMTFKFIVPPTITKPSDLDGSKLDLLDFYPAAKPPNALNSAI